MNWLDLEVGDKVKFTKKYLIRLCEEYKKDKIYDVVYIIVIREDVINVAISNNGFITDYYINENGCGVYYYRLPIFEIVELREDVDV